MPSSAEAHGSFASLRIGTTRRGTAAAPAGEITRTVGRPVSASLARSTSPIRRSPANDDAQGVTAGSHRRRQRGTPPSREAGSTRPAMAAPRHQDQQNDKGSGNDGRSEEVDQVAKTGSVTPLFLVPHLHIVRVPPTPARRVLPHKVARGTAANRSRPTTTVCSRHARCIPDPTDHPDFPRRVPRGRVSALDEGQWILL